MELDWMLVNWSSSGISKGKAVEFWGVSRSMPLSGATRAKSAKEAVSMPFLFEGLSAGHSCLGNISQAMARLR